MSPGLIPGITGSPLQSLPPANVAHPIPDWTAALGGLRGTHVPKGAARKDRLHSGHGAPCPRPLAHHGQLLGRALSSGPLAITEMRSRGHRSQ